MGRLKVCEQRNVLSGLIEFVNSEIYCETVGFCANAPGGPL